MPRAWALLALLVLFTTACGGDPPDKEMQQAQGAIDAARAAGAAVYAAEELGAAQLALKRAEEAVSARDYRLALNYALDSRQRAQNAAKLAADGMAATRVEADRSITRAAMGVDAMRTRLKSPDVPRLPARTVSAVRELVADADRRLQEARTAQDRGDYKAAQTAAADANTTLSMATKDLEVAAAGAAKRRR
jgi:Domain of unknown function (DUF4398)